MSKKGVEKTPLLHEHKVTGRNAIDALHHDDVEVVMRGLVNTLSRVWPPELELSASPRLSN